MRSMLLSSFIFHIFQVFQLFLLIKTLFQFQCGLGLSISIDTFYWKNENVNACKYKFCLSEHTYLRIVGMSRVFMIGLEITSKWYGVLACSKYSHILLKVRKLHAHRIWKWKMKLIFYKSMKRFTVQLQDLMIIHEHM